SGNPDRGEAEADRRDKADRADDGGERRLGAVLQLVEARDEPRLAGKRVINLPGLRGEYLHRVGTEREHGDHVVALPGEVEQLVARKLRVVVDRVEPGAELVRRLRR